MQTNTYTHKCPLHMHCMHIHLCILCVQNQMLNSPYYPNNCLYFPIHGLSHFTCPSGLQAVIHDSSFTFHSHSISKMYYLCLQTYIQNLTKFSSPPLLSSWPRLHPLSRVLLEKPLHKSPCFYHSHFPLQSVFTFVCSFQPLRKLHKNPAMALFHSVKENPLFRLLSSLWPSLLPFFPFIHSPH